MLSSRAVEPRAVQTARGNHSNGGLGQPFVGRDPRHHRREVGALREDRSAFDDRTARGVRTGQARHQSENPVVVHNSIPFSRREITLRDIVTATSWHPPLAHAGNPTDI